MAIAALLVGYATTSWQWHRAELQRLATQHQLYVANMNLAQAAWEQNNITRVRELLKETATAPERGFEWYYWQRQLHLELRALRGHTDSILAVAYSPDGHQIVTGGADNSARVWDAETGQESFLLKGHTNSVRSVAFSKDGQRIVTGSSDRTIRVWEAATGRPLRSIANSCPLLFGQPHPTRLGPHPPLPSRLRKKPEMRLRSSIVMDSWPLVEQAVTGDARLVMASCPTKLPIPQPAQHVARRMARKSGGERSRGREEDRMGCQAVEEAVRGGGQIVDAAALAARGVRPRSHDVGRDSDHARSFRPSLHGLPGGVVDRSTDRDRLRLAFGGVRLRAPIDRVDCRQRCIHRVRCGAHCPNAHRVRCGRY